jgi:DNA-binding CsgD family transcriptional regulator
MNAWKYLLIRLGIIRTKEPRPYELNTELQKKLIKIAEQQHRSPGEIETEFIQAGLNKFEKDSEWLKLWEKLSPREQQVAALTCLGYINKEIALQLSVSPETVKAHVSNLLEKFNLHSKLELKEALAGWDFSEFGKPQKQ